MKVAEVGVFEFEELPKSHRRVTSVLDDLPALEIGQGCEVEVETETELNTFRAAVGRYNKSHPATRLLIRQLGEGKLGVYCVDPKDHPAPQRTAGTKKGSKKSRAA